MNLYVYNVTEVKEGKPHLILWCKLADGSNGAIRVYGYHYKVQLLFKKVSSNIDEPETYITTEKECLNAYNLVKDSLGKIKLLNPEPIINKVTTLYYGIDTYAATLELDYMSLASIKRKKFHIDKGRTKVEIADTVVPHVNKFFNDTQIKPGTWIEVSGGQTSNKETNCKFEYVINFVNLSKRVKILDLKDMPSFRVLSYDLECYCSVKDSFPRAFRKDDKIIIISCHLYEKKTGWSKTVLLTIGDCEDIEGTEIIRYPTEKKMIEGFLSLIRTECPDIITGYNIFGFDNEYLHNRYKGGYGYLGRSAVLESKWKSGTGGYAGKGTDDKKSKSGYSSKTGINYNNMNIIEAHGILYVDGMGVMMREHKLKKYSLEEVSQTLLGEGKVDVNYKQIFRAWESVLAVKQVTEDPMFGLKPTLSLRERIPALEDEPEISEQLRSCIAQFTEIMEYAKKDAVIVNRILDKKNTVATMFLFANSFGILPEQVYVGGQQVKTLSRIYEFCVQNGYIMNSITRPTKRDYEGAYVGEPKPGRHRWCPDVDFSGMYPNIVILKNICYSTFVRPSERHISKCKNFEINKEGNSVCKQHPNSNCPKPCPDNCTKHKVWEKDCNITTTRDNLIHWFLKSHIKKGVIPRILENIIAFRKEIKKLVANAKTEEERKMYFIMEMAVKVIANSIYGIMGAQEYGKLVLLEGAESITATGKDLIGWVNDFLSGKPAVCLKDWLNGIPPSEDGYVLPARLRCQVNYNDTDSSFFEFEEDPGVDVYNRSREVTRLINEKLFGGTNMEVALEKVTDIILFEKKKNYCYIILNEQLEHTMDEIEVDGKKVKRTIEGYFGDRIHTHEGVMSILNNPAEKKLICKAIKSKGDALVRRDKFQYLTDVYSDVLIACFFAFTFEQVIELLHDRISKLINGEVPESKLYKTATYNAGNSDKYYINKFIAYIEKKYNVEIESGTKLDFLVLKNDDMVEYINSKGQVVRKKAGTTEKACLVDMLPETYEIDYAYYVKGMIKSIDPLIRARFTDEMPDRVVKVKVGQCGWDSIFSPTLIMHKLIERDIDTGYLVDIARTKRKMNVKEVYLEPQEEEYC